MKVVYLIEIRLERKAEKMILFYVKDEMLRCVLFIVQAGNDIIKADFVHIKRTTLPTKMKIGIHLEEPK